MMNGNSIWVPSSQGTRQTLQTTYPFSLQKTATPLIRRGNCDIREGAACERCHLEARPTIVADVFACRFADARSAHLAECGPLSTTELHTSTHEHARKSAPKNRPSTMYKRDRRAYDKDLAP
jgi:hypothetical protein